YPADVIAASVEPRHVSNRRIDRRRKERELSGGGATTVSDEFQRQRSVCGIAEASNRVVRKYADGVCHGSMRRDSHQQRGDACKSTAGQVQMRATVPVSQPSATDRADRTECPGAGAGDEHHAFGADMKIVADS